MIQTSFPSDLLCVIALSHFLSRAPPSPNPNYHAMDRPFYYRSAEDVVPRDVVHVIICGSVTVVPPRTFEARQNLLRVQLQDGVEEIGAKAFRGCRYLERVDFPSSIRTIHAKAFLLCWRLSGVILREGLRWIREKAFYGCGEGTEKITVPSSVVEIGDGAFTRCRQLSELNLQEGLRRIGKEAFKDCGLRSITVPPSVIDIGEDAFTGCDNLEAITLSGGMVMLERTAFRRCRRLERIAISSVAIIVDVNGNVASVTGGIERDATHDFPRLILASPHLGSMRPQERRNVTDAIDQIAGTVQGVGGFYLADGDVFGRIRECFANHLSTWYREYKREVATTLELTLWKIELGRAVVAGEAMQDRATRDECRIKCGANPIVGVILSSLAGPHRRVDQGENAGSIQP